MRCKLLRRACEQRGFTLIELLIALVISSLIVVPISMAFVQIMKITSQSRNHMLVVRQLQTAGYWVSRDSQMAKDAIWQEPASTPVELPWQLTLSWEDVTGTEQYKAVYSITADNSLERAYYINNVQQGEPSLIAEHVVSDPIMTNFDKSVAYGAVFTVTASIGDTIETRVYDIMYRLYVPA